MSKTINDLNKSLIQNITPSKIGAVSNSDLDTVKNNIGTVSDLKTEDKTIVGAINELSNRHRLTQDNGGSIVVTSGSINDIRTTGFYTLSNGVTDGPFSGYNGWYHLEVLAPDVNWVKQVATIYEATGYGTRMYIRGMQDGTWAPWREFIDSSVVTVLNNSQLTKITDDSGACRNIPNNNANDITITGFWMGANVVNGPSGVLGSWIYLESFVHNDKYQMQRATDLHDSSIQWVRHKINNTWSNWVYL